jgi:hypothetical protein
VEAEAFHGRPKEGLSQSPHASDPQPSFFEGAPIGLESW